MKELTQEQTLNFNHAQLIMRDEEISGILVFTDEERALAVKYADEIEKYQRDDTHALKFTFADNSVLYGI